MLPEVAVKGRREQGGVGRRVRAPGDHRPSLGVHDVPLLLLGRVVQSRDHPLWADVGRVAQGALGERGKPRGGALQQRHVDDVVLQVVRVLGQDSVKALDLDGGSALPDGEHEGGHPADAATDLRPAVAGDGQGHALPLDVVEGGGRQLAVREVQAAKLEHAEVQQLNKKEN